MTFETFTSHDSIVLTLNRENSYGMKPLQINKSLGFSSNEVVTLEESLTVLNLRAVAWIESLSKVSLPNLAIEDSREQKAEKMLNLQWTSPRKRMDLFLLNNQENHLLASFSLLNPSGYPYTQYEMMEALDSVNDKYIIANNFDLGIQIVDDGFGFLDGDDKITIYASVEKKVTVLYKSQNIIINPPNQNTPPTNIILSSTSIDENVASNTVVGTFSATGSSSNTFTYSLVSGEGSTDNGEFTIDSNSLKINDSPDYETKSSYSIRIQVVDGNNSSYQKQFTITVNDENENQPVEMLTIIDLKESGGNIVNSPTSDISPTTLINNGATASNGNINFSGGGIILQHPSAYDLNQNFKITWEMSSFDSSTTQCLIDLNDGTNAAPRIYLMNTDSIKVYGSDFQDIGEVAISGTNLSCEFSRINGNCRLKVNEVESEIVQDSNNYWGANQIAIGTDFDITYPYTGEMNNIKLFVEGI